MKKLLLIPFLFFANSSFGWPWEKPDISKISVEFKLNKCKEESGYFNSCEREPTNAFTAKINNKTDYYIKSLTVQCFGYDKDKNRVFNEKIILQEKSKEISPNNLGEFFYGKLPISTINIDCTALEAEGSKK